MTTAHGGKQRLVAAADRETYRRDGAIALRGVIPAAWIERMRSAIDRFHSANPQATIWMARMDEDFAALTRCPQVTEIAAELMEVPEVRFFYDQLFVRPAQSQTPTPLHQDLPYWPIEGADIISIWVPFDDVRAGNGVVQYVKGSQLWGKMYEPAPFTPGKARAADAGSAGYEVIEDPDALIEREQVLCWDLSPGDVLVHHPLTLHYALPNTSKAEHRRAVALRYVGPNSQFIDRPGNFMRRDPKPAGWPVHPILTGAPIVGPDYPLVWQR